MLQKLKYFIFLFLYSGLIFLVVYVFKPVPENHNYKKTTYYKETVNNLKKAEVDRFSYGLVKVGWSKANITPKEPQQIIGFGVQPNYEKVNDSVFVRSFVFEQGRKRVAYLSFDLLLVHPKVAAAVKRACIKKGLQIHHFYFTATHSHNSYGAFDGSFAGSLLLGKEDPDVINFIAEQTALSIEKSILKSEVSTVAGFKFSLPELVNNRISNTGKVDTFVRGLAFKNQSDEKALLYTYAAHAASLAHHVDDHILSADYPGETERLLEEYPDLDLVSYSAGGVGSHNPRMKKSSLSGMKDYSKTLSDVIKKNINDLVYVPIHTLSFLNYPVTLNNACLRLNKDICIGQNGFKLLFELPQPSIDVFKINNYILVSTPCDFSGELVLELEKGIPHQNMIFTSFNGEYIGYITPDRYYNTNNHREQYALNWFGYGNGSFFKEILRLGLEKK